VSGASAGRESAGRESASGEIAVIGLGSSGRAAAMLLAREGCAVYASDAGPGSGVAASAKALVGAGAAADAGHHDLARIARASLVVASPGVPPDAPPLAAARAAGVPIVSEVEIALARLPGVRYIAVTGTNGKTTTTALVAHLLQAIGRRAVAAGNIGMPLAEVALSDPLPEWVALELSSFQLHDTPSVRPAVGVLTNLSPDHLDRYRSAEDYYADKALLFANASAGSAWVLNADDPAVMAMGASAAGRHLRFSLADQAADACLSPDGRQLMLFGSPLLGRGDFPLMGNHNVANALAAALAVSVADAGHQGAPQRQRLADGLKSFRSLAHRLQVVGTYHGVQWIDDSKATNVSSTLVALQGMTRPTVLLLGGRHKGEPYTALAEPIRMTGKIVLAYGEAAPRIVHDLSGLVPVEQLGSDFTALIARARECAAPGDAVLLSPACSSFDMFRNYEERGATFARLAGQEPSSRP
jgi:UDP-N-acetylmuramoylalanine--D-glutamate ligase